jgi:hypothetical protein
MTACLVDSLGYNTIQNVFERMELSQDKEKDNEMSKMR